MHICAINSRKGNPPYFWARRIRNATNNGASWIELDIYCKSVEVTNNTHTMKWRRGSYSCGRS